MFSGDSRRIFLPDAGFLAAAREGSDNRTARERYSRFAVQAVGSLPEKYRQVIEGYYLEGKTMRQIADELGLHKSTVGRRRRAAVKKLSEMAQICAKSGLFPP